MNQSAPDTLIEDLSLLVPPSLPGAPEPIAHRWPVAVFAVLVVVAILALWLKRRHASRTVEFREDPSVVALRELDKWNGLSEAARFRGATAAISGTVRRYVEARFEIRAPRMTTEEFFEELHRGGRLSEELYPSLENFTIKCDAIKYGGATPEAEQFRYLLATAFEFVNQSKSGSIASPAVTERDSVATERECVSEHSHSP